MHLIRLERAKVALEMQQLRKQNTDLRAPLCLLEPLEVQNYIFHRS